MNHTDATAPLMMHLRSCAAARADVRAESVSMRRNFVALLFSTAHNLGDKKGGFLKQILSISIQEKLIKIGDG